MGELKSCLFCGKRVDGAFEYCPHCGYEFGEGDEKLVGDRPSGERMLGDLPSVGADLPGLLDEDNAECAPAAGDKDYLHRLHTLQEMLSDMERELDLILSNPRISSKDP